MENIIILILFTYPGAIADFYYNRFTDGLRINQQPDEYIRIARDFFLSVFITAASMGIFCPITGTRFAIAKVAERLMTGIELLIYIPISFALAWITAKCWAWLGETMVKRENKKSKKEGKATDDIHEKTWAAMMDDSSIPFNDSVYVVRDRGQIIAAGLVDFGTKDPEKNPWVVLRQSSFVEEEMGREDSMLGQKVASCVNLQNGITVDIYDGKAIREYTDE